MRKACKQYLIRAYNRDGLLVAQHKTPFDWRAMELAAVLSENTGLAFLEGEKTTMWVDGHEVNNP